MSEAGGSSGKPIPASLPVVIPCYNAGEHVRHVVEKLAPISERIVVVDDGSTDGCVEHLRDYDVDVVTFPRNRGKGHALVAGFEKALEFPETTGVAVLDADGQHDPAELPALYEAFEKENADLVIGARAFKDAPAPWTSRFGNTVTRRLSNALMGTQLTDTQSGFRIYGRDFLQRVLPRIKPGRYETEMDLLVRAVTGGFNVTSVPIRTIYEQGNPTSHFRSLSDSVRVIYRFLSTLYYSYHQDNYRED